ncbi:MAG: molybdopterin molybdotransferase MoeA [Rhodothermales bacterium]|nr:molybdopterin molybdotransferase MoeA [Rhodothermales bacterium]
MQTLISVENARLIVLDAVRVQPVETIDFDASPGRTLAEDIVSQDDIPPFANSAMDGFALLAEDVAGGVASLEVIDDIPAGAVPSREVTRGTCARIMTGAPVPAGANAIAPVEWTEALPDGRVRIKRAPAPGMHVRPAGQDARRGQRMMASGEVVTPPGIGMLATLGYARVAVRKAPVVAVIATGDELLHPSEPLTPGRIRNSSGYALCAQVAAAGGEPLPPLLARDTADSIRLVIQQALVADVLVFSGGVSVGDYDLVKQQLDEAGMELLFWKVKQRPGNPLAFGLLQGKPVFGLPGNPVSSAMCFEQYVRPALARMLGRTTLTRPRHPAILAADTAKVPGLHFFSRGVARYEADGRLTVRDTGSQASNLYSSVLAANCIIHLPESWAEAKAGTQVEIEWLTW